MDNFYKKQTRYDNDIITKENRVREEILEEINESREKNSNTEIHLRVIDRVLKDIKKSHKDP